MPNILSIIQEKKEVVDAYRKLQPSLPQEQQDRATLEFVYTSNLIEGSTLSRIETNQVITKGLTIGGKTLSEQNTAVSDMLAVSWITRSASLSRQDIDEQMMSSLHHLPAAVENEGGFLKYSYQVPYILTEFSEWLHAQKGSEVEVAVSAFCKLLEVKPFQDRNPRTARLLCCLLLLMDGYPLLIVPEELVSEYRTAVEQASRGEPALLQAVLYDSILSSLLGYLEVVEHKPVSEIDQLWKIGELAAATNESVPTIRHWTKQGLLKVANYTDGGYQLYHPSMAETVLKIRQLQQEERMKIGEIKEVLSRV